MGVTNAKDNVQEFPQAIISSFLRKNQRESVTAEPRLTGGIVCVCSVYPNTVKNTN